MKYYTEVLYKSVQFYSYYFVSQVSFDMFIIKKLYTNGAEFEFESAKQTVENNYKENVLNNFNEKILFFYDLKKYLIDERRTVIPLNDYNFFKLRMYAIKCLNQLNDAENVIKEERLKIKNGEYPIGVKELAQNSFQNYNAIFIKDDEGLIVQYYNGDEASSHILRFLGVENYTHIVLDKQLGCIIGEEIYEENNMIIYNVLFDNKLSDGRIIECSVGFKDVKIINDDTIKVKY